MSGNKVQIRGLWRGGAIAAGGGILGALAVIATADWSKVVDHTSQIVDGVQSIIAGLTGLAMIVAPMVQAWRGREPAALAKTAAEIAPRETVAEVVRQAPAVALAEVARAPVVEKIVAVNDRLAATIPSLKVVGPSGN